MGIVQSSGGGVEGVDSTEEELSEEVDEEDEVSEEDDVVSSKDSVIDWDDCDDAVLETELSDEELFSCAIMYTEH